MFLRLVSPKWGIRAVKQPDFFIFQGGNARGNDFLSGQYKCRRNGTVRLE
jgi:hypothetical protein